MGINTGLPKRSLRKSERKRVHNDEDNLSSVVNVELRAFEKLDQPTDKTAKTNNNSARRWVNDRSNFSSSSTSMGKRQKTAAKHDISVNSGYQLRVSQRPPTTSIIIDI